jgi:methylated-DNA-[protein]-cysteine S-methyltransferase
MTFHYRTLDGPIGPLTIAGHDDVVHRLSMHDQRHVPPIAEGCRRDDAAFPKVADQLAAYFAGELTEFDLAIELGGSPFQRRVWEALLDIPYGRTSSYGELAARIGKPGAARAVGLANGRNPIAIVVPCHRVIGASGTLTGYGGGLERKRHLLDLESGMSAQLAMSF